MMVTVRFAGHFRRLSGQPALKLDLAEGATVEDALAVVDRRLDGRLHDLLYVGGERRSHPDLLLLVDTRLAGRDAVLQPGSVLALVPPMAGG